MNNKVFVLGLDGATFELLAPMIAEGRLPNFSKVVSSGASCSLASTIPPTTPVAWTSLMTGKDPGDHGIFGFIVNRADSINRSFVDSTKIKSRKLWQLLTSFGKRTGLINVPLTYPAEKVDGFMVPGFPCPDRYKDDFTYPVELYQELLDNIGDYVIDIKAGEDPTDSDTQISTYLERIKYMTKKRREALFYLMEEYEVDFLMIVFVCPDRIQHRFWKWLDVNDPLYASVEAIKHREAIIECYVQLDDILGEILARLDSNYTLIIMSDHGFGPLRKYVQLNNWLLINKLLQLRKINFVTDRVVARLPGKHRRLGQIDRYINWNITKVFSGNLHEQGIYINLKGREKFGIVNTTSEYRDLSETVTKQLLKLEDPETSSRIVDRVLKKEEVYKGKNLDDAPDLAVVMRDPSYVIVDNISLKTLMKNSFITSVHSPIGFHRREGVFIAYGNHVLKGAKVEGAAIVDVMPTILYLMDLPIPNDIDGKVLKDIFKAALTESRSIEYIDAAKSNKEFSNNGVYSEAEQETIRQQLQDLGYL